MDRNERTPLGKRLVECREESGLSQAQVAKAVEMSQGTLAGLEIDGKRSGYIPSLAALFRVDPVWLATGKGEKKLIREISNARNRDLIPSSNIKPLQNSSQSAPVENNQNIEIHQFDTGGAMGAGVLLRDQPGVIQSWRVTREWLEKNVKQHSGAKNLCIVTGFGDSMRPMFEPGDPLLVDMGVNEVSFDAIYFFRIGSEGFIKRLQRIPGEGIRAISENKAYESWTIRDGMDFEVFGRVLKAWRSEVY